MGLEARRLSMSALRPFHLALPVDDLDAARGAGVIPIGVIPPGSSPQQTRSALEYAGAARVLENTTDLQELLP